MNDCPQGLKSCANPATAAIQMVQARKPSSIFAPPLRLAPRFPQFQNHAEHVKLPVKQSTVPVVHSPHQTRLPVPESTQLQVKRLYPVGQ